MNKPKHLTRRQPLNHQCPLFNKDCQSVVVHVNNNANNVKWPRTVEVTLECPDDVTDTADKGGGYQNGGLVHSSLGDSAHSTMEQHYSTKRRQESLQRRAVTACLASAVGVSALTSSKAASASIRAELCSNTSVDSSSDTGGYSLLDKADEAHV